MSTEEWVKMPDEKTLMETAKNIRSRGFQVIVVEDRENALKKIVDLIPAGVEVMNGSSTTLIEIGFSDYMKSGKHQWKSLHEAILKEADAQKRAELRRKSVTADYFLGSVNAISKTGELVACDASGSRVGAYPFAAKNLILVAGIQKIVPNLEKAIERVKAYVYPLEDARAKKMYGTGTSMGKWVIIDHENIPNRTTLILVKEKLGF